jgi:hypothetical protein
VKRIFCVSLTLSLLVFAASLSTAQQFKAAAYYSVGPLGAEPSQIVTGDFNRDGNLDLAVADTLKGGVAILLGNGDGTFQTATHLPLNSPNALGVADVNGDGIPDLIVLGYTQSSPLTVFLGNGDGTFTLKSRLLVAGSPVALTIADLNGDGKLDVAVANSNEFAQGRRGYISIFFGHGDGTFTLGEHYNAGNSPWSIAAADLNGDGHTDLVVSSNNYASEHDTQTLFVLLNNGDGTFTNGAIYNAGVEALAVSIADFNHDGKQDLAVSSGFNQELVILLGNGDGTFSSPVNYSTTAFGFGPYGNVVADFNGDGNLDVAVNLANGPIVIFFGNSDGAFQPAVAAGTMSQSGGQGIVAGDFNNDGAPDLAASIFQPHNAAVLINTK